MFTSPKKKCGYINGRMLCLGIMNAEVYADSCRVAVRVAVHMPANSHGATLVILCVCVFPCTNRGSPNSTDILYIPLLFTCRCWISNRPSTD